MIEGRRAGPGPAEPAEPVTRTTGGAVRGRREAGVAVFRGIPFAEPPARFAAPRPVEAWAGIRAALEYGPPPPQSGLFGTGARAEDEGWLTVNVWTPDLGGERPVMVWIQGGGYLLGWSGLPEYDGGTLARGGDVVVVTFNHRVGVEGFASVEGAPANRGLLDQVAALEWVRENIGAFGGDSGRVTVFGQSAGAGCVAALLAMPSAAGLFHRAIVQSMPGTFFTPELAADITAVLSARLQLEPGQLGTVPPGELPVAADEVMAGMSAHTERWGLIAHRRILMAPMVDGDTLPTDPWTALRAGAARDVALVVGHTRHEHRLFALLEGTLGQVTEEQATAAVSLFAPGRAAAYADGSPEERHDRVHSDWLFRMPSQHLAEAHTGHTWLYELTWPGALGACHGLDVPLVFGNLTSGQPAQLLGGDLTEAAIVSEQLRGAWTGFATTGDPSWPRYEPEHRLTRIFDTTAEVLPYPEEASRRAWRDHVFSPLHLT